MGLLTRLLMGELVAGQPEPTSDFWYQPIGALSSSGMRVDRDTASKVSAFYRGVDLLSTALAMLPLPVYRRLANDEGREVARQHPLFDVLHRKPNGWQDSFRWRRMKMRHLIHRGNAYDRIVEGPRGFADQLWPIPPDRVKPEQVESGRILYHVRQKDGSRRTYVQEQMFHLCGATDDGVEGKGILEYACDSLGLAIATESYASRLFSQGSLHGGIIKVPGPLNEEAAKRMAKSFVTKQHEWHMPVVLEQGADWLEPKLTPEDSQFIASRKFSIDDIARWLGLPPHMIGSLDRSTNNNIEHQGQEFIDYSLGPWLTLFEFAINDQLILRPETYYAEFTRDALVRGDIATRWEAYQKAVTTGVFTRNEIRVKENMNRLPGLDEPLNPAYITGKDPARSLDRKAGQPPPLEEDDEDAERARAIVVESAARLLRKEVKAVRKLAVKHAPDPDAFAAAVTEFYHAHAALVATTLAMPQADAEDYCAGQAAQVLTGDWTRALQQWRTEEYAAGLAGLALEKEAA